MLSTRQRLLTATLAALFAIAPAMTASAFNRAPKQRVVVAMKASDCSGTDVQPTSANLGVIRAATLCLLNVERTQRGRLALRSNGDLTEAAGLYAREMVENRFFDHVSPAGTTFVSRIKRSSYLSRNAGWALGENLAWGEAELASPASIVAAWMRSPDHKRNILEARYVDIGIGIAYGTPSASPGPSATFTTEFGTRTLLTRA
jgi:uncharacterized protein YkwD